LIDRISVTPHRNGVWAVKHGGGYLGYSRSRDEAITIGRTLVDWLSSQGRSAELKIERSFAPSRDLDSQGPAEDDQAH
jgi:hypothetical protein